MPSNAVPAPVVTWKPRLRQGRLPSLLAVGGAAAIWSTSFAATKVALADIPPLTVGALRFLLAAVLLGAVAGATGGVRRPAGGDAPRLAAGGLLGVTLYFALENVGVQLATAADAALLVAAYPAITLLLEAAIFRTPVANVRLAGAGVALLGVYLIVGGGLGASGERRLLGDLLLVASGVAWAFYSFVTRTAVRGPYPMPSVVFWQTLTGAVAFLPLAWTERDRWQAPAPGSVLAVVYLGIFCSVVAFLLYARGLRGLDAGGAVALMNLVPFLGLGLAVFVLREPVTVVQVAGGLVVLVGVGLGVHQHSGGGPATRGGGG